MSGVLYKNILKFFESLSIPIFCVWSNKWIVRIHLFCIGWEFRFIWASFWRFLYCLKLSLHVFHHLRCSAMWSSFLRWFEDILIKWKCLTELPENMPSVTFENACMLAKDNKMKDVLSLLDGSLIWISKKDSVSHFPILVLSWCKRIIVATIGLA